ncbi:hypothetical protein CYR52_05325 [Chimaeribacter arupi]|nr:hypothetical protein CYR52_05325 [Chimaeribacter arupi]
MFYRKREGGSMKISEDSVMNKDSGHSQPDLQVVLQAYMKGESVPCSPTEAYMHEVLTQYIDALNQKNPQKILDMYAEDAVIIDPVGANPVSGKRHIETFVREGLSAMRKAELSAPIRTSPGGSAAMAFTINMDFGDHEVLIQVVDVMRFNADGKIVALNAHWGVDDIQIIKGEKETFLPKYMPDVNTLRPPTEAHMRGVLHSYLDHINNKDVDAFLGLFAQDFSGEDPVGTAPITGLENLASFVKNGMASRVELNAPVRATQGKSAAMAFSIHTELGGQNVIIDVIDVMKFNEAGEIVETKAYWGEKNVRTTEVNG